MADYPYMTKLSPAEELEFQRWAKLTPRVDLSPFSDYDYRGYWKAMKQGLAGQGANNHYPDTFKTPYHRSFSNESKYALPGAPSWQGDKLVSAGGATLVDETKDSQAAALDQFLKSLKKAKVLDTATRILTKKH